MSSSSSKSDKASDAEKPVKHESVLEDYKAKFPHINERRLIAKIDLRLMPAVCLLWLLAFLDRVNIGNAQTFALSADLKLVGNQYNAALVIFSVPYILGEIPSNISLRRFKPHVWLSGCMFLFGMITCLQGTVKSFSGILATRFFLGLCECGVIPGCFYLISMWYKREEAQKRCTVFFCAATLAGAFGGLVAGGIGHMNGIGGNKAWRWIFILEGLGTCVLSAVLFFVISDFPEDAKWLTEDEKTFVKQRLYKDVGDSNSDVKITFREVLSIFKDYKIIAGGFMLFGMTVCSYSFAYFSPAIIQNFGHGAIQTQLYTVPPWVVAFVFAMIIATLSDKYKNRFSFFLASIATSITGYVILLTVHHNRHVKYGALFMVVSGVFSATPVGIGWFSNNLAGHSRRSIGIAWQVGFGNIGSIVASFAFLSSSGSNFTRGYVICICSIALSAIASAIYFIGLIVENRRRDKGLVEGYDLPENEKVLMGDLNPDYRYML